MSANADFRFRPQKNTKFKTLSMKPLQLYAAVTKVRKEENLVEREPARTSAEQVIVVG